MNAAARLALLPSPQHLSTLGGTLDLRGAVVDARADATAVSPALRALRAGLALQGGDSQGQARIVLHLDETLRAAPDGYAIAMDGDEALIRAGSPAGLFYGAQTLLQLAAPSPAAVPRVAIDDRPLLPLRAVHLDLRSNCLMPTFEAMIATIEELARFKVNAVVIEWEDKFPYQSHPEIASPAAFTPQQVREIIAAAHAHHVQVIPLLQTLGHVEFVLKHPRFTSLRERTDDIAQFCPCEPAALALAQELLDEILAAHPDAPLVHLGADETYLLGSCPRCATKARERGLLAVYADHVGALCQRVLAAGATPMIWGDVLQGRHVSLPPGVTLLGPNNQALAALPPETRMMYWDYHSEQPSDFAHFDAYERHGYPVWVAPTTRYGDLVPEYSVHLRNIAAFAEAGIAHGAEGALITSWVYRNMPTALTWYGLACGAERMWSGTRLPQEELDARFTTVFHGVELPAFVEATRLLDYPFYGAAYTHADGRSVHASLLTPNPSIHRPIPDPASVGPRAQQAAERLTEACSMATRNRTTLEIWTAAARLVAHTADKQRVFAAVDALFETPLALLDPAGLAALRQRVQALIAERETMEQEWRVALGHGNVPGEIERALVLRFAGERAHACWALEQLRAFEASEGFQIWR